MVIDLLFWFFTGNAVVFWILLLVSAVLLGLITLFFRVPLRNLIADTSVVYSPADGTIVDIDEAFYEDEFLNTTCKKVSIFMSVFNVHQNRVPVSGKIIYSKHHPGKYLVAWNPKSSLNNERNTLVVETGMGQRFLVRQIAGFVARRIISNPRTGDLVNQGDELGFILFGSRVDVFMPMEYELTVHMHEKVKGNITRVAHR